MRYYHVLIAAVILIYGNSYSFPGGVALRTLKTTTLGCGNCHVFGSLVTGSFSGPDTVTAGSTVQFTINYLGTNAGLYGVDIAVKNGVLAPGESSAYLKILSNELVQKTGLTVTSLTFDYTAPVNPGIDSLYATIDKGEPGKWNWVPGKRIAVKLPTGIKQEAGEVSGYELKQNVPNPSNPVTRIGFSVPRSGFVSMVLYDISGRLIRNVVNNILPAGNYSVVFDAAGLSSGVYYYRLVVY